MAKSDGSHLLVAAFDFGTTYSGYAFSFRDNPFKVQTNQSWNAASEKLISLKTPTCVLLDPQGQFHSFGFQAENKYADLAENDKHHGWRFFRRFKMMLHNNEKLSRHTTIEDINGKKIEAMTIFTMSIKYLKDHFLGALLKQTTGVEEDDILYVLTVPAIWDDSAKQFMREAAVNAGIDTNHLKLALEPEAASIWCQVVTEEAKSALAGSGTKYMVVDLGGQSGISLTECSLIAGSPNFQIIHHSIKLQSQEGCLYQGGTADITVHEKLADGTLKELHKASGGPWGGMYVDNNYMAWLENLFGTTAMDKLKMKNMEDYFDLLREFETKKRSIITKSTDAVTFRISAALRENSEEAGDDATLEARLNKLHLGNSVTIRRDKMKVDQNVIRDWFKEPVNSVVDHVKEILTEPSMKGVNTILLVGGFGESQYVHEVFQSSFTKQHLIVPHEAGLAVLKGAVRYGHLPTVVSIRVMKYTYGISATGIFDESKHPISKVKIVDGKRKVPGLFNIFVRVGETIATSQEVTRSFRLKETATLSSVPVFNSLDPCPIFITDPNCKNLGKISFKHPKGSSEEDAKILVTFIFGETEFVVKARFEKSGEEFHTTINCLE